MHQDDHLRLQEIRDRAVELLSPQAKRAAQISGRVASASAVDVNAADFDEG